RDDLRRDQIGQCDGDDRRNPDERSERRLVIHFVGVAVLGFGDGAVDEVGSSAGDEHDDAHHEDPDKKLDLNGWIFHREENKSDERDASDAVGFKTVGTGAYGVARVVASAVGNNAGVARVVFFNFEDDFHEIGADVGDFGEDAAGDSKRGGAEGFA